MNKNIKLYILNITIFIILIIPNNVFAASSNVSFICDNEVIRGANLNCLITTSSSDFQAKGIQLNYEFDDKFSYEDTVSKNNWDLLSSNNEGMMAIKIDGTKENETITNTKFLVSNDAEIGTNYTFKIKNIILTDGEKDISVPEKSHTVKVLSILDIIESIKVDNEIVTLKDGVTNYTFEVGTINSINLEINLKSDSYTFKDNFKSGKINNLEIGDNIKNITILKGDTELLTLTFDFIRNGATTENIITNPKTGNKLIIPIILIVACIIPIIYYRKKRNTEAK